MALRASYGIRHQKQERKERRKTLKQQIRERQAEQSKSADARTSATAPAEEDTIRALNLASTAEAAAKKLKKQHPEIVFTSGRRTVKGQAQAMASNIVSSEDRKWIEKTYTSAAELQKWVDNHKEAVTVKGIAKGLEETMNAMNEKDRSKISKHLTGEAFDVQPVKGNDAIKIKSDIKGLPRLDKFLDKEGGLVLWHVQFRKRAE